MRAVDGARCNDSSGPVRPVSVRSGLRVTASDGSVTLRSPIRRIPERDRERNPNAFAFLWTTHQ
jgi:hypothetical protein